MMAQKYSSLTFTPWSGGGTIVSKRQSYRFMPTFFDSPSPLPLGERKGEGKNSSLGKRGFTLIEVVIVLVLLAIVAAIALPSFQRLVVNSPLKTAARDLMGEIALQKERAIAESRQYRLVLDVNGGSYDIQQCQNTGSTCGSWSSVLVKNLNRYANDISFDSGSTTVTNYVFQTRGTVTNGTIVLRNNRNSTATIRINIAGRTNVQFNLQ